MEKQPKSKARETRMTFVVLTCLTLLFWFGFYLWTYDYSLSEPPGTVVQLRATLRICDGTESYRAPGVVACFTLVNLGQSRVRVVETQALTPLYNVKLLYQDSNHGLTPAAMTAEYMAASTSAAVRQEGFDQEKDSVVELPAGSALTHFIPLSQIFDLRREGKYELTVAYRPGSLVFPSGQTLEGLKAYDQELQSSASFQLPQSSGPSPEKPRTGARPAPAARRSLEKLLWGIDMWCV